MTDDQIREAFWKFVEEKGLDVSPISISEQNLEIPREINLLKRNGLMLHEAINEHFNNIRDYLVTEENN